MISLKPRTTAANCSSALPGWFCARNSSTNVLVFLYRSITNCSASLSFISVFIRIFLPPLNGFVLPVVLGFHFHHPDALDVQDALVGGQFTDFVTSFEGYAPLTE